MKEVEKFIQADIVASLTITREPLRAYAMAVWHRLVHVARLAAREVLQLPRTGREYVSELEDIPAGALHRLQVYHMLCSDAARTAAMEPETWSKSYKLTQASKWWTEYMTQATMALGEIPSGATVTRVDLLEDALIKAAACPNCPRGAFGDMRKFSEAFAVEVDRVTSKIELEIKL